MGSEWRECRLEDIAAPSRNALVGGPFGSDLVSSDYVPSGVPVIRGENVSMGRWVAGDFVFVSEEKAARLASNTAGPLDLVFTQRGANHYRQVALVPPNSPGRFVISQSQMKLTVDPAIADPLFIYYLMRAPEQQAYLERHAIQTGVPHTNLSILRRMPVRIPPLSEQRATAAVLCALDDKIELNRRMSRTLESMARALFKSWFVDFDPVRAKAEGRDPSGRRYLADLFPDSLGETELGELPSGWRVGTFGDVATSPRRPVKPDEVDPATPYIGLEHMPRKSIALAEWGRAESVESGKTAFHRGEILFGKLRPYFHKVGVAPVDGVCSTDIVVVTPKDDAWSGFVLGHASSGEFVDYTNATSSGTKMPRTSWSDMARFPLVEPPAALAAAFTEQIGPAVDRMISSIHEMRTLATVRDFLLPVLVCGRFSLEQSGWPRGAADA
jgi:type I restriction enzyme S subunit